MTPADPAIPPAPLSKLAYARHRKALGLPGADESSVRRAVKDRRIPPELVTANGKIRDADAADRAWRASTRIEYVPLTGPTAPKRPAAGPVPDLLVGDQAVVVRFPLAPFLAGVAEALREAGREPTPTALAAVVAGVSVETWWMQIIADLNGRIAPGVTLAELEAFWRQGGREAVTGPGRDDP